MPQVLSSSFNQALPASHGIGGPQGWTFGTDFADARWFTIFPKITENGNASAPVALNINDEEKNGILLLTTGAGDNDSLVYQCDAEFIKMEANESYWMVARWNVETANDSDFLIGFGAYDNTDAMETPGNVVDGVYWQSLDGSTDIDFVTEKDGTQVDSSGLGSALADDTFVKVAFQVDVGPKAGAGRVRAWLDDVQVHDSGSEVLPTEVVGPFFNLTTGSAAVKKAEIDYFFCGGSDGR